MAKYRTMLPQTSGDLFLTDGGLETTLIFHNGLELPEFAAFDLLKTDKGRDALREYFESYAAIAAEYGVGFIFETATWRANPDYGTKLGYSDAELADMNREAVQLVNDVRAKYEGDRTPMAISGCVGPRYDGYDPEISMSESQAESYHNTQIGTFKETAADLVTAITMTSAEEAIGITRAASVHELPVVISFTVETDGTLPNGQPLKQAIEQVDQATQKGPSYYMINCAHPTHFSHVLETGEAWTERIKGIRANASTKSHAELDEAEELDDGDPVALGGLYRNIRGEFNHINVLGGCCGTDHRHIEEIVRACKP